jgi:hypothetical protein
VCKQIVLSTGLVLHYWPNTDAYQKLLLLCFILLLFYPFLRTIHSSGCFWIDLLPDRDPHNYTVRKCERASTPCLTIQANGLHRSSFTFVNDLNKKVARDSNRKINFFMDGNELLTWTKPPLDKRSCVIVPILIELNGTLYCNCSLIGTSALPKHSKAVVLGFSVIRLFGLQGAFVLNR